jgi:flagellar hook-associated protein 2
MSTSSSISSLGVGSGLDAESIVTKLVALERQPITQLQSSASKIQTKISAYGKIQSAVSSFRDAAAKLAGLDLWQSTTATSSDSTAANISTTAGAAAGNYNVGVSKLAAGQSVVSNTSLSSTSATLGSGSLSIQLGTWDSSTTPPGFTNKSGSSAVSVTISATDTLDDIRTKINNSGSGVNATIVNDASGARLVLQSANTGESNGFKVTATDADGGNTDGSGVSALAYDPSTGTTGTTLKQAAGNAKATINGVEVSSATNTLNDVMTGISLTLGKVTTSDVNIVVAQDTASISKAINDFATSYTSLANLVRDYTKYDSGTKVAGTLQGDTTAVNLQQQFRSILRSNGGGSSTFGNLSSVGLEMSTTGTLTVNSTKLNSALNNTAELKKLFNYTASGSTGSDGIATQLRTLADQVTGTDGLLSARTTGLNSTLKTNQSQQDKLEDRATLYEKRLRAQYTALDTKMAAISSTSNYVTQMINSLNSSG